MMAAAVVATPPMHSSLRTVVLIRKIRAIAFLYLLFRYLSPVHNQEQLSV